MNKSQLYLNSIKLFSTKPLRTPNRLSMNLLVKNEVDIIADNIKFHATQGVDCFVVMDNGSTDGTREAVAALAKDYEIHLIDRITTDYQQSNWKSEMAFVSRDKLGAQWSIANDADEFWLADSGDLKNELRSKDSIVNCKRHNMIMPYTEFEKGTPYYEADLQVNYPIFYQGIDQINDPHQSIMLGKIHGKVIVNNQGLLRVKGGNHRAWHLWERINERATSAINVYHYPIREKEHFVDHIKNRQILLDKGVTKMGNHYRRWCKLYKEGLLEEELQRLMPLDKDIESLLKFGIVRENNEPRNRIKQALGL